MKTKIIISILVCSLLFINTYTQTEKGSVLLGGSASTDLTFNGGTIFGIGLSPDAGYFVEDDIAIGAWVPLSLDLGDNYRVIGYGIVPFFRYYVDQMDDMMYFITANIGFTGNATKIGGVSDSNTGLVGGAGMGVTYMLTESVGVEGIIGYSFNKYKDVDLQSRIGIDIGFQVYFNP